MNQNERITENLVRDILRELKYYDNKSTLVEEQKSQVEGIQKSLKGASKTGKGGVGAPEFIISTTETPDFLIIIECKADPTKHESSHHDKTIEFAVDGVLHYAKKLSMSYNIIAVAVSGQTKASLKISNFIFPKGGTTHKDLVNRSGKKIESIISLDDYIEHGTFDPDVAKKRHNDLMDFSRELHNFMRDHAKLTESEKPLLVSGTFDSSQKQSFCKKL